MSARVARKIAEVLGDILITLCLAIAIVLTGLIQFTAVENLRPALVETILVQMPNITQQELALQKDWLLQRYCPLGTHTGIIPANESGIGIDIAIVCIELRAVQPENLQSLLANAAFNAMYHKDYSCDPLTCLQRGQPEALLSAASNAWFSSVLLLAIVGVFVGVLLVIIGARRLAAVLKETGISVACAGLGAVFVPLAQITTPIPAAIPPAMSAHIAGLFSSLTINFAILLATGIALAIVGFVVGRKARMSQRKGK